MSPVQPCPLIAHALFSDLNPIHERSNTEFPNVQVIGHTSQFLPSSLPTQPGPPVTFELRSNTESTMLIEVGGTAVLRGEIHPGQKAHQPLLYYNPSYTIRLGPTPIFSDTTIDEVKVFGKGIIVNLEHVVDPNGVLRNVLTINHNCKDRATPDYLEFCVEYHISGTLLGTIPSHNLMPCQMVQVKAVLTGVNPLTNRLTATVNMIRFKRHLPKHRRRD